MSKEEKEKLVPNLRFKGFTDDWIQEKLGNYVTFYSGLTYSPKNVVESDNGTLVLRSSNIQDDTLDFSDNVYVNQEAVNSKYVEKNDIVVVVRNGSRRLLGKHAIIKNELKNTVIGAFMTGIQAKSPYFINSLLSTKTFEKEMYKDLGATINQITNKNFKNMTFNVPQTEEADNIGDLFQKLDTIITLEQEKFKQFELVYHALIQKLLISDSSTGPEIRIENHHQNWVLQKVSDIFKITRGNVLAKSKVMSRKDDENIYPVFSSQTMDNGLMGYFNKYLFENAITWTTDGANAGTVTYRRDKFYSTNVNGVLLSEEGYASEVVALILNNTAYKYVSYVGNPKLMNNVMADIKIYLPTDMVELDKLNLLFVHSKNILHKMEQSTLRYKNIKKILLRNLFV